MLQNIMEKPRFVRACVETAEFLMSARDYHAVHVRRFFQGDGGVNWSQAESAGVSIFTFAANAEIGHNRPGSKWFSLGTNADLQKMIDDQTIIVQDCPDLPNDHSFRKLVNDWMSATFDSTAFDIFRIWDDEFLLDFGVDAPNPYSPPRLT